MVHAWRASMELQMHAGSWEITREAFEWHEANSSASLTSRVLYQILKCIHNSIEVQVKHGPILYNLATATLFRRRPLTRKSNFFVMDTVIVHT